MTKVKGQVASVSCVILTDIKSKTTRTDLQALLKRAPREGNHFEFGRRVKFGMKLKKLKGLLDELDGENRKLERFTDKTERLEPCRAARSTSIFNPALDDIRSYAKHLYGVVCVGAGCSQSRHQAKLQLEKRLYQKPAKFSSKQKNNQPTRSCFRVSLYDSRWQDVEVEILLSSSFGQERGTRRPQPNQKLPIISLTDSNLTEVSKSLSLVSNNNGIILAEEIHQHSVQEQTSFGKTMIGKQFKSSKGGVECIPQPLDPIVSHSIASIQKSIVRGKSDTTQKKPISKSVAWSTAEDSAILLHPVSIDGSKLNNLQEVIDICTAIRESQTRKACLGLCLDHTGKLRRELSIQNQADHGSAEESLVFEENVTLDKILSSAPNRYDRYDHGLSLKDRKTLALILASSFVQLEATQWISDSWGKEDIIFDQDSDTPGNGVFDVSKPCILRTQKKEIQSVENYSLLNLGVLLLELSTGESFEKHQGRMKGKDVVNHNPPQESVMRLMKLSDTSNWLDAVQDHLSYGVLDAIRYCIQNYRNGTTGKSEANFRQSVLEQVVFPLQDDLQIFLGPRNM